MEPNNKTQAPNELTILGKTVRTPLRKLEWFPKPDNVDEVRLETEEWTSVCPITGQPDFCQLSVTYGPDERCLESKAFKLYVWSFRDEAAFVEQIANQVANDIWEALEPNWVIVEIRQNIRGGIGITAIAQRTKYDYRDHEQQQVPRH